MVSSTLAGAVLKDQQLVQDDTKDQLLLQDDKKDQLLPEYRKDQLLPEYRKDQLLPEDRKDHLLPEYRKDHLLPEYRKDHLLPEDRKDHLLPEDRKDQLLPEDRKDQQLPRDGKKVRQNERRSSSTGDLRSVTLDSDAKKRFRDDQEAVFIDVIFESYKSLINEINTASNSFKEGKKWRCNEVCSRANMEKRHDQHPKSWKDFERALFAPPARKDKKRRLTHSRTTDESPSYCERSGSVRSRSRDSRKQLVRQMATEDHGSGESLEGIDQPQQSGGQIARQKAMRSQGRMPSRQWTVDGSTGMKPTSPAESYGGGLPGGSARKTTVTTGSAFLLRPVSKTSVVSGHIQDLSSLFPPDRPPSQAKRAAIAAAVAAAGGPPCRLPKASAQMRPSIFSTRTQSAGEVNQQPVGSSGTARYAVHIQRLQKQPTSESAPTPRGGTMSRAESGLPRQHSSASAYSAGVSSSGYPGGLTHSHQHALYNSYSTQGITMIRGASCSLVDIPTYLGPSVRAVELSDTSPVYNPGNPLSPGSDLKPTSRPRPRLQLDLTQRKNVKSSTRKTKWTILCVGLTLLMMSVTIVGTMLSLGSQYQEMVIAKQWETLTQNKTHGGTSTTSAASRLLFPIVKDVVENDVSNSTSLNNDATDTVDTTLMTTSTKEPVVSETQPPPQAVRVSDRGDKNSAVAELERILWWPT